MMRWIALLLAFALLPLCGAASAESGLPSRYDMREYGIVTPVKLQYPWGSCWSFGAVAAAETSILSAMGKTYDEYALDLSELHAAWFAKQGITAADDPVQAGEGPVRDEDPENRMKEQYRALFNGQASMVSFLFSTGAGPVEESTAPYHGREKNPEIWLAAKDPEKWIDNYILMNGDSAATLSAEKPQSPEDEAEEALQAKRKEMETGYYLQWYSGDDWSLPVTMENGESFRNQRCGFLLTDENFLPEPLSMVDPEDPETAFVPNEEGMNAMKREMLNGHAVALIYKAEPYSPAGGNDNLYINYDTWANYTYESAGRNHVICIVGWDDDYPAENFTHEVYTTDRDGNRVPDEERTKKTTPPGNGAWLMKNSRGSETDAIPDGMTAPDGTSYPEHRSDWGLVDEDGLHTGYNWVSYYDQSIARPLTMAFSVGEDGGETGILQYDYLSINADDQYMKESGEPVFAANVFTADRDMEITAVSARPGRENSQVSFTIIRLRDRAQDPEDGEQLAHFTADFRYAGFHQAKPEQPIPIRKGDRFSVITETRCDGRDGERCWMYSAAMSFGGSERAVVNPGESFVKENGSWQDWSEARKTIGQMSDETDDDEWEDYFAGLEVEYDNFGIKVFYRKR